MGKVFPFDLPFDEAVNWFKAKKIVTRAEFDQMDEILKARAFTAAFVMSGDLLQEVYNASLEGVEKGQSYHEYSHRTEGILTGAWHRETVFRTNTLAAYGLGHYQQAMATAKLRPYVRYTAIMDTRTRPAHARLHGLTFRAEDPGVRNIWPPIGYNCRCSMHTLTEEEVAGLKISKPTDPGIGPDDGFSSPAHGGFFDVKAGKWSPWLQNQVQEGVQIIPELDPKARHETLEVTPWDYKGGEVPAPRIPTAEDLEAGLKAPPKAKTKPTPAPEVYDPELEILVKKSQPLYTSTQVPPGKYHVTQIPGLKQVPIAEEDLLINFMMPPSGLTSAEWEWIQAKAKKEALKTWEKMPWVDKGIIDAVEKEAVDDLVSKALGQKAAGKSVIPVPKPKIAMPAELQGVVTAPEWNYAQKEVLKKVKSLGLQEGTPEWEEAVKLWTSKATDTIKNAKAAGQPVPGYKPKLTKAETKELDSIALIHAQEEVKNIFPDLAWENLTAEQQGKYLKAAKKLLKENWIEQKAAGNLDEHIAQIKANLSGELKAKAAALDHEAEAWAQNKTMELLAEYPPDAQPASDYINALKAQLKEAYVKKGGVPNEVLSGDAGVGISVSDDPLAPSGWKAFDSRAPAHSFGMQQWSTWRKSLTSHEFKALQDYKGAGYVQINNFLRLYGGGTGKATGGLASKVQSLDSAFAKAKIPEPVKVFRGCSLKTFAENGVQRRADLPSLTGQVIIDKGYPSCGLTERSAWVSKGVLWEIRCPPGTPACYLETVWNRNEYEILLGRNLKYKILSVDMNYSWSGREVPKVIAEVIL